MKEARSCARSCASHHAIGAGHNVTDIWEECSRIRYASSLFSQSSSRHVRPGKSRPLRIGVHPGRELRSGDWAKMEYEKPNDLAVGCCRMS